MSKSFELFSPGSAFREPILQTVCSSLNVGQSCMNRASTDTHGVCNMLDCKMSISHHYAMNCLYQGPFVQSVVSLTSSLRVISLTLLADSIFNILIFFAEKNVSSFCIAKATHIFSAKNFSVFAYHPM